ncbi:M24 family metallopeptidase ['Planchonia careya' phytoplasma]|nr:M24 family metallopeptidase ['Planchonia careya' phytoplasma]MDO8030080.1 M24 family metallopeptidase ['Planchonia careya' phytoplasma]
MQKAKNAFEKNYCCFGKNALIFHYNKNNSKLNDKDICLMDEGIVINNYSSEDITCCFPLKHKFTSIQNQIYDLVLNTNKILINWVKLEHSMQDLNRYGKQIIVQGMLKLDL